MVSDAMPFLKSARCTPTVPDGAEVGRADLWRDPFVQELESPKDCSAVMPWYAVEGKGFVLPSCELVADSLLSVWGFFVFNLFESNPLEELSLLFGGVRIPR